MLPPTGSQPSFISASFKKKGPEDFCTRLLSNPLGIKYTSWAYLCLVRIPETQKVKRMPLNSLVQGSLPAEHLALPLLQPVQQPSKEGCRAAKQPSSQCDGCSTLSCLGAPNSPKLVLVVCFRPQSTCCSQTWSPTLRLKITQKP